MKLPPYIYYIYGIVYFIYNEYGLYLYIYTIVLHSLMLIVRHIIFFIILYYRFIYLFYIYYFIIIDNHYLYYIIHLSLRGVGIPMINYKYTKHSS